MYDSEVSVGSGLIFAKMERRLVQIFPQRMVKLWNDWELCVMVLLSLFLQIILILFGTRRKYIAQNWVRVVLWIAYLYADYVATLSLGILSNNDLGDKKPTDPNTAIRAFWAPFLLLHLGGPDNFTAYSIEDNELWLRHLLGLVVEVGVAIYVTLASWTNAPRNFVAIPVFIAGIIKYSERIWCMMSASTENFRESLLPPADPGPSYVKFMEEYRSSRAGGLGIAYAEVVEVADSVQQVKATITDPNVRTLHDASLLFDMFKRIFSDLILSLQDIQLSLSILATAKPLDAFKVIEIELGFMYDFLYTKATLVFSRVGILLRSICLSSMIFALAALLIYVDMESQAHIYRAITYLLLFIGIFLEFYGIAVLLQSDWTLLWVGTLENQPMKLLLWIISSSRRHKSSWWSNSMAQHNLLFSCLKDEESRFPRFQKALHIEKAIEIFKDQEREPVSEEMKKLIFEQLKYRSPDPQNLINLKQLHGSYRGEVVLKKMNCFSTLGWSIAEVEFDQSLLLWHVATELCCHLDLKKYSDHVSEPRPEMSQALSNYMMYILAKLPSMLPKGIGQIRYADTCAEAKEFFSSRKMEPELEQSRACMMLLQLDTEILPNIVKGNRSKSVLFDAVRLAKLLQSLETEESWKNKQKWEMVSEVWVEMLSYAASQCGWNHHAQQLRRGGELLTHVCLLMTHLGLSEQFQISQGEARMWV